MKFGFEARVEDIRVVLASKWRLSLGRPFSNYSRSGDLIDPDLTGRLGIQTFTDWNSNTLPFGSNELVLHQFDDPTHIFSTLLSDKLNHKLNKLLFSLILEGNFLIEDELVIGGGLDLICDGFGLIF